MFSTNCLVFILFVIYSYFAASFKTDSDWEIHGKCNHRSRFTSKELNAAKNYLESRYRNGASVKPQRPVCKSLKVIPDFRCISDYERHVVIKALLNVYRNTDFINNITYIHTYFWPFVNIMAQANSWHNMVNVAIQKEIEKFDPSVVLPYWDITLDGSAPEKSLVWKYLGHAGNRRNRYCVPDGPFRNLTMKYPDNTCLRREWNNDGTMNAWETPEVVTYALQQGIGSLSDWSPLIFSQHFKMHMSIGGLRGDMGNVEASNEPAFYLFHWFEIVIHGLKWQLESNTTLVDLGWNQFGRHVPPYEFEGYVETANIEFDTLLGFNTTTAAEAFQFGFGELCYISDRTIEAILGIINNRRTHYPPAVQRLRNALPSNLFAEFFPKFADNSATELNYHLPDVGNTNRDCKPIPVMLNYSQTEHGRQMLDRFNQAGVDVRPLILRGERKIYDFINSLNRYGYCSPYVSL